jgi:uncharacterized coiled-coil protein SlyX
MGNENRDFVIERLEKQVAEKEQEIKKIKDSLKDSIIEEIHQELDINNLENSGSTENVEELEKRVSKLEDKVKELGKTLEGMMEELLDQKSILKNLENQSHTPTSSGYESGNSSNTKSLDSNGIDSGYADFSGETSGSKISEYTKKFTGRKDQNVDESASGSYTQIQEIDTIQPQEQQENENNVSVEPEYIIAESGEKNHKKNPSMENSSEYIIAESGEKGSSKKGRPKRKSNEYIVADGDDSSTHNPEPEEKVEHREDEDAEIITNDK